LTLATIRGLYTSSIVASACCRLTGSSSVTKFTLRRAPPQRLGLAQRGHRRAGVTQPQPVLPLGDEPLEPHGVDGVGRQGEGVAGAPVHHVVGAEGLAQP
jgi:hypothetical protein